MRTKTFTSVILLALVAGYINVSATVWRVNPTPNSSAHYSTAQAAHDAATTVNNDTLYLEGSTFSFGGLTLSKKLTIIGNGYFLAQNPQTQYNISPSTFNSYIYCYAGGQGSKFIGCTFQSPVYLYSNNFTFERNNFVYGNNNAIYSQANCSDILILNNYFETYFGYQCISFTLTHSNILIANNYFNGYVSVSANFSGIFANNIFNYPITIYNSTLVNNIALQTVSLTNCVSTYNIGNSTQFGNLNGNQQNVAAGALFLGATGNSTDGQWQLKVGSPAIGAGEGGTDIGMYGGEYPYILSGLPPIPAIYSLDAQSLPSNTLDVNLKAKSHN
jgi:hypothetical protein